MKEEEESAQREASQERERLLGPGRDARELTERAGGAASTQHLLSAAEEAEAEASESSFSTLSTCSSCSSTSKTNGRSQPQPQAHGPGPYICRICLEEDDPSSLETPCSCSGTQRYAHHRCIQRWIEEKGNRRCEVCEQLYRGAYVVPQQTPLIPPNSPFVAGGTAPVPLFVLEPAQARAGRGLAGFNRPLNIEDEEEEEEEGLGRHPGVSWCFTFMVFFALLQFLLLHRTIDSEDDYEDEYPPNTHGSTPAGASEPPAPYVPDGSDQQDWMTDLLLFVIWAAAKSLLIGIPLYIVMRLAARQAHQERIQALARLHQHGRAAAGPVLVRVGPPSSVPLRPLVRPDTV